MLKCTKTKKLRFESFTSQSTGCSLRKSINNGNVFSSMVPERKACREMYAMYRSQKAHGIRSIWVIK